VQGSWKTRGSQSGQACDWRLSRLKFTVYTRARICPRYKGYSGINSDLHENVQDLTNLPVTSGNELLPVNVLWVGGTLGPVEQLSILSFLNAGHRVRIHAYDSIGNVPPGTELVDAALTVPRQRMEELRHARSGSYSLSADLFRYVLQAQGAGIWADLDMICVGSIPAAHTVFGFEVSDRLNIAILYLEKSLPIIDELVGLFRDNFIPPWVDPKVARKRRLKRWLPGYRIRPAILPWGTYGPMALTELASKHGLLDRAAPIPVFYPLAFEDAHRSFDPAFSFESIVQESTRTIHLWNEALVRSGLKGTKPPKGSPLDKLFKAYGL